MRHMVLALTALIAFSVVLSTSVTAKVPPRDALSGLWRLVPSFEDLGSRSRMQRLCSEKFRTDTGGDDVQHANFMYIVPHESVYLYSDEVYFPEIYRDVGLYGVRQIEEQFYREFGVRKFHLSGSDLTIFLYTRADVGRPSAGLRIRDDSGADEYFVKCDG